MIELEIRFRGFKYICKKLNVNPDKLGDYLSQNASNLDVITTLWQGARMNGNTTVSEEQADEEIEKYIEENGFESLIKALTDAMSRNFSNDGKKKQIQN